MHFRVIEVVLIKNGVFEDALDWSGVINQCTVVIELVDTNSDGKADLVCGDVTQAAVGANLFSSTVRVFLSIL